MEQIDERYKIAVRILKEMNLNYKNQYPEEIPDMHLVVGLIYEEIHEKH